MRNISGIFSNSVKIITFLILVVALQGLSGCEDEDPVTVESRISQGTQDNLTVVLPVGECKSKTSAAGGPDDPCEDEETVHCLWDGQGGLVIRHVNAALNCCPVNTAILTVDESENGINIDESMVGGDCDCYCLFDLEFNLTELPPGTYSLTILCEDVGQPDPTLQLDLDELVAGEASIQNFCFERNVYPWPPD